MEGGGVVEVREVDHFVVSGSIMEVSFGSVDEGARRVMDVMLLIVGRAKRVERILEPAGC